MALNIKDENLHSVVRKMAAATGETQAQAVATAVYERWDRLTEQKRTEQLLAIGRRSAAHILPEYRDVDHSDILYDEQGLPK